MSFTTEEKIARLIEKGWVFDCFKDTDGNHKINAKFYETIGRKGNKKNTPLYNLYFKNKNDLVRELYYSSIGTQRDLAKEFGITPEEITYIKTANKHYMKSQKDGEEVKVKVQAGKLVKCVEDIRFHLSQIQNRPYNIYLRKGNLSPDHWNKKIETMCNLLTKRTGTHFHVDYTQNEKGKDVCIIFVDDIFPIYEAKNSDYYDTFSYLNSLFALTNSIDAVEQRNIIGMMVNF